MNKILFTFVFFFSFILNSFGQYQHIWEWKPLGTYVGTNVSVYNDDKSNIEIFSFNWEGPHVKYSRDDSRSISGNREEFSIFLDNCQNLISTKGSQESFIFDGYEISCKNNSIIISTPKYGIYQGYISKSNLKKIIKAFNLYIK